MEHQSCALTLTRYRLTLIALLLAAAVVRAGFVLGTPNEHFLYFDGKDYQDIASNLVTGRGYSVSSYRSSYRWFESKPPTGDDVHPDFYRPPLLPLLGVPLWLLPGSWMLWARIVAVALGILTVFAIYLVAKELFSSSIGLTAAGIFAFYPFAVYWSSFWSTETLMAVCLLLATYFLARCRKQFCAFTPLLVGLSLGLTTLARPNGLLQALALLSYVAVARTVPHRGRAVALILVSTLMVLTPWIARNLKLTGVPNPVTFQGPFNMWLGTNENMYQLYRAGSSASTDLYKAVYGENVKRHVNQLESSGVFDVLNCNAYWLQQTWEFVSNNPGKALYIYIMRFLHFWRFWVSPARNGLFLFWVSIVTLTPLSALAVHSLLCHRLSRDPLLLVPIVAGLIGSLPFIFGFRLRFPVYDPFLVLLASPSAFHLGRRGLSRLRITTDISKSLFLTTPGKSLSNDRFGPPSRIIFGENHRLPDISVVIPVYNGEETLGKCLEAIYQSKYPPYEVIVVDDCSTDNSLAVASQFPCRVVKLEEKHGAAKAKNRGAEEARGDIIFFTDADIMIENDTLSRMIEDFADTHISAVVGLLSKEVRYDNFCSEYKNLWMHYTYAHLSSDIGNFYTSAAAIRRTVFQENTGFDENYRGASVTEDAEFGQRLLTAGHKIYLDKRLTVKHLKHYSLFGLIKTDFWRSWGLTKTFLRNKFGRIRQKSFTSVPWFFILSVLLSSLAVLSLLLSILSTDYRFLTVALIGWTAILLLNAPFLNFLRKTRGWSFLGKSCGFLLIDTLVVVLGMLYAATSFVVGKKF